MRNILLFITVMMMTSLALQGQVVNIPDANFKSYLVGNMDINTNGNNEIENTEASSFTGQIYCISQSIRI